MDLDDRSRKPRGRPSRGGGSRRHRRASPQMGRAAASDRAAQAGAESDARGAPQIHGRQDRQMVDARRRRLRRGYSAYRNRQDPEDGAARAVQGLSIPERRGLRQEANSEWGVANKGAHMPWVHPIRYSPLTIRAPNSLEFAVPSWSHTGVSGTRFGRPAPRQQSFQNRQK